MNFKIIWHNYSPQCIEVPLKRTSVLPSNTKEGDTIVYVYQEGLDLSRCTCVTKGDSLDIYFRRHWLCLDISFSVIALHGRVTEGIGSV